MAKATLDFLSSQLTNLDGPPPKTLDDGPSMGGKERVKVCEYTIPVGGLAVSKNVEMARLPKGCRILPGTQLITEDMGASTTLSIGYTQTELDTSDDVGLLGATSVSSVSSTPVKASIFIGSRLLDDTSIYLRSGGGTLTAGKKVRLIVRYLGLSD